MSVTETTSTKDITYTCGHPLCPSTKGQAHRQENCPQPVRIELKRLSISERLSQETTAFAADVWVDGKKAGSAENDGHGGSTFVRWHATNKATVDRVEAFGKSLMPPEYKFVRGDEWIVDTLVEAARKAKEDAREAKKVAKEDAKAIAAYGKDGLRAARFKTPTPGGYSIRWVAFKGEVEVGLAHFTKKYPTLFDWTVLS